MVMGKGKGEEVSKVFLVKLRVRLKLVPSQVPGFSNTNPLCGLHKQTKCDGSALI